MRFTTPHGSVRYRLPWSWSAFDYRELCRLLDAQNDARFETAKVERRTEDGVLTDRGELRAPLVVKGTRCDLSTRRRSRLPRTGPASFPETVVSSTAYVPGASELQPIASRDVLATSVAVVFANACR